MDTPSPQDVIARAKDMANQTPPPTLRERILELFDARIRAAENRCGESNRGYPFILTEMRNIVSAALAAQEAVPQHTGGPVPPVFSRYQEHQLVEEAVPQPVIAALKYWQKKKLALDAVRPDFTDAQLRELNAAESRLLAIDVEAQPVIAHSDTLGPDCACGNCQLLRGLTNQIWELASERDEARKFAEFARKRAVELTLLRDAAEAKLAEAQPVIDREWFEAGWNAREGVQNLAVPHSRLEAAYLAACRLLRQQKDEVTP